MLKKLLDLASLAMGIMFIYFLGVTGLPYIDEKIGFKEAHDILKEEKIEAGAWYYIFVEKVGPSSENIRHTLKYSVRDEADGE